MNRIIGIAISFLLIILGALIGEGFKSPLYFYWVSVLIICLLCIEVLLDLYTNKKSELQNANDKVSTLLILKGNKSDAVQIALFPKEKIFINKETQIDLFVTSSIPTTKIPDVKLITKTNWEVKISNQTQREAKYADGYEYILRQSFVTIKEDRFIHYKFFVIFDAPGKHDFSLKVDNGEISGQLKSSIIAHRVKVP
ncbi:hypothetical protein [Siminovitchia sp. FSL W7-1587]|uniref:hypothetical protein n=1 Tax=Siminovitchia sp. FSL W7-1587 TaxID=2954699 RepID=UPI0030D17BA5